MDCHCQRKKIPSKDDAAYLRHHTANNARDPHEYFYLLYKVHKKAKATRPVCSDCGSLTYPLSKWVDLMLQPVAQLMPSYIKDLFSFKSLSEEITLPRGSLLWTADAVSMYTNIDTHDALSTICPFLRENEKRYGHYHAETLISAIEIVMQNSIMKFGDVHRKQISGTAMGKPPAPSWATIYEGVREIKLLPRWETKLPLFVRYIDDDCGAWAPENDISSEEAHALWERFKAEVNSGCLKWEFSELSSSV